MWDNTELWGFVRQVKPVQKKAETQTTQSFAKTLFQIRYAFDNKSEDEGD